MKDKRKKKRKKKGKKKKALRSDVKKIHPSLSSFTSFFILRLTILSLSVFVFLSSCSSIFVCSSFFHLLSVLLLLSFILSFFLMCLSSNSIHSACRVTNILNKKENPADAVKFSPVILSFLSEYFSVESEKEEQEEEKKKETIPWFALKHEKQRRATPFIASVPNPMSFV